MAKTLAEIFKAEDDEVQKEAEKNRKIIEEGFEFEKSPELEQRTKDLKERRKQELLAEDADEKK